MHRRVATVLTIAAMAFSVLSLGGSSAWASSKVTASGNIACHVTAGKVKFSPPLINGGTVPTVETYKLTLGGCFTQASLGTITPIAGPAPALITGGTVKGSVSFTTNRCPASPVSLNGKSNGATVKWKGASHYVSSEIGGAASGFLVFGPNSAAPGTGLFDLFPSSAPVTGSFGGSGFPGRGFISTVVLAPTPTQTQVACTPKSKSIPGSGGFKKAGINPALSYLLANGT